ncbi:superoxide dismutase family protein [Winogradskyella haliclonae]|uniref:Superoxide dismutase [Cu-Zn] n=1 Tax=Winogradskyella haliclonae TaxID=2048558 RepID=A0ABQ2C0V9_9FLAO|nr:superoxide dismutase family protein [Winogradskyella haliclonae]GGI57984.1 superoxide dismutase [Cu-Zn] [Winogradskyella haliclonae]
MKNVKLIAFLFFIIIMVACKNDKKTEEIIEETQVEEIKTETSEKKEMTITLSPKSESNVEGTVTFKQVGNPVMMTAKMTGLTEGTHAIHIHQTADCSSADGKSTGGHWNPTSQPHGKWGDAAGFHKGDIGNFEVGTDGKGEVQFSTDQWCIGCGDETKDILGKAIIVHQGTDDFTSQPSGAAGKRVSCAGIIE